MKNKKRINKVVFLISLLVFIFLFSFNVFALEYSLICLDNSTLLKTAIVNSNISGTAKTYYINQSLDCFYGCDSITNNCNPDPFNSLLIGLGILMLIIVAVIIIARRL